MSAWGRRRLEITRRDGRPFTAGQQIRFSRGPAGGRHLRPRPGDRRVHSLLVTQAIGPARVPRQFSARDGPQASGIFAEESADPSFELPARDGEAKAAGVAEDASPVPPKGPGTCRAYAQA